MLSRGKESYFHSVGKQWTVSSKKENNGAVAGQCFYLNNLFGATPLLETRFEYSVATIQKAYSKGDLGLVSQVNSFLT